MLSRRRLLRTAGAGLASSFAVGATSHGALASEEFLFHVDFAEATTGDYAPTSAEWGGLPLDVVSDEYLSVVETADGDRVLDARFPEGVDGAGNTNGGGDFIVDLGEPREELYCAYRIRFDEGFEFHQPGGKLPGFAGTHPDVDERSVTGGDEPTGENGWSARMMWRDPPNPDDGGLAMFYVYHPDMPGDYGENVDWDDGPSGQVHFQRGEWHRIEHRVVMNAPGENDGVLEGWFDGEKVFERTDLRFRDVPEIGVDDFYFSLFFGGGQTEHWGHDREEHVQFDDLVVSTDPIWLGDDEPPAVPGDLTGEQVDDHVVALSWSGVEDAGSSGLDGYRVSLDGVERERVPAGTTAVELDRVVADERHVFEVTAVDTAGNASEPASVEVVTDPVADDAPPPAVGSVELVDRQLDWLEVSWPHLDAPDDEESGFAHYEVLLDDEPQRVVPPGETSARLDGLEPGTSYEVGVRTVDLAGNRSEPATASLATVPRRADDALVVNTFEDGLWPGENQLGQWAGAGSFANGEEGEVVDGALRLEYDDAGWLRSRMEGEHDVSGYDQLTLLVRGDAGGEQHHCTVEIGEVGGVLADLSDDPIRAEWTAVRIDLDAVDAPDAPAYVYASFTEGSAGAVEIDRIRFDHGLDAGSGASCGGVEGAESAEVDGQTVCDLDGDGEFRDVTGDGGVGQDDVVHFFENQHRDAWKQPGLFDFSGSDSVGHGDVVALFEAVSLS